MHRPKQLSKLTSPLISDCMYAIEPGVNVKFEVDGVEKIIASIVGVKQGDLLGPDLFIFFMAAILQTWRSEHDYELCVFRSRPDYKLTGRKPTDGSAADEFTFDDSEYADDSTCMSTRTRSSRSPTASATT